MSHHAARVAPKHFGRLLVLDRTEHIDYLLSAFKQLRVFQVQYCLKTFFNSSKLLSPVDGSTANVTQGRYNEKAFNRIN